jgi:pyruvate, orthophosphate dikinase
VTHVYAFDHPHESPAEMTPLLGGKGANLADMTTGLGLPVPAGFTITTATCRHYLNAGWPDALDAQIEEHVGRLEAATGRRFGDPADPLLVSVRSGAPVSMPGMMDTVLNLGINTATASGLAEVTGDHDFARDCQARFGGMFRSVVGVEVVPEDPWEQLHAAIAAVFDSWNSDRAKAYRDRQGIAEDLGTAVTVQAMVFGNRGPDSATGVMFTRDPATGADEIYGDLLFDAQGEDVVAGTHQTVPLTVLDERLPSVGAELRDVARRLERRHRDLCDIEFTVEEGKLWLLQVRVGKRSPQAALRIAVDMAEDPDFPLTVEEAVRRVTHYLDDPPTTVVARHAAGSEPVTVGLAASPGLAVGEVVTSPDEAIVAVDSGREVVLVRSETSPADVHGMAVAKGVLTARGGLASHAAVVARGWGIPAVVGASAVEVRDHSVLIGATRIEVGETISVNGSTGEVFLGDVAGRAEVVPHAATLLDWATQLGIEVGRGHLDDDPADGAAASDHEVSVDDVVTVLSIKGLATPDTLAPAAMSSPESVGAVADKLVADGLVEQAGPMIRLTDAGTARAEELMTADRSAWGADNALAALDGFLVIDQRMKLIVTRWQLKDVDGEQVPNDHLDRAYDDSVLAELVALHDDASGWLASLSGGSTRLDAYVERLTHALDAVLDGDHRFIASPMIDSYHSAWFELHEHLIRLAGRTRAEETEAGRA